MVEFHRTADAPSPDGEPIKLCIVGIGGAGSNVLDRITLDRTMDGTLVCMHTDVRVLGHAMAPVKVQLGTDLMRGVGAGGDPDLGREAALFSRDAVRQALNGHQIIFICAGLGGGTGSGAAPVIAEIAKSTGALVLVVATMPFSFEGRRRVTQAEEALELLQKRADALILFENNRMGELILPKDGIQKAFSAADQLISQSLRAVSTMIATPGLVRLGLDDLTAALASSNGRCLFGFGEARGQNRGAEALKRALKSPLIDQGRLLHHTRNLLVHVAGGETLTLMEVEGIMKQVGRNVPDHTQILFGVAVDAKLGDAVAVTLISSLGAEQLRSYSQSQSTVRVQVKPELKDEPTRNPAVTPAAHVVSRQPELLDDEVDEEQPQPAPSAKTEPLDLFVATSVAPPFAKNIFKGVEEEEESEFEMERPEPREDEQPEGLDEPASHFEDENEFESKSPQVVADMEETGPVPLSPARSAHHEPMLDEMPMPTSNAPTEAPPPTRKTGGLLATVSGVARTSTQPDGDMFEKTGLDRGDRFKDTEPSLVEGEDLDVPTWMRLKKRLKK